MRVKVNPISPRLGEWQSQAHPKTVSNIYQRVDYRLNSPLKRRHIYGALGFRFCFELLFCLRVYILTSQHTRISIKMNQFGHVWINFVFTPSPKNGVQREPHLSRNETLLLKLLVRLPGPQITYLSRDLYKETIMRNLKEVGYLGLR